MKTNCKDAPVALERKKRRLGITKMEKRYLPFYIALMAIPVLQFCIFYIYVNFNSIVMAFQSYDTLTGSVEFSLANFKKIASEFQDGSMWIYLSNSFTAYAVGILIMPLTLFFPYYIYKKYPLSGFFKVLLFLPSIISNMTLVVIFTKIIDNWLPSFLWSLNDYQGMRPESLMAQGAPTVFPTLIFFGVFTGFGGGVLMYSGAMSQVSPSIVEAAHIDGANTWQEFYHVILPSIFPTISTFLITGVAGIFTNQLSLFSFYGPNALLEHRTLGYYVFKLVQSGATKNDYSYAAAIGLLSSVVLIPTTFLIRYLLEKFGPSEE